MSHPWPPNESAEFMRKTMLQVLGRITMLEDAINQLQLNLEADKEWAADLQKEILKRQES